VRIVALSIAAIVWAMPPTILRSCARAWAQATPDGPDVVEYRDDRLTVRVTAGPLARVLSEIARASGAEVRGAVPAREVTATLDRVPLSEALATLLGEQSFVLRYGSDGALRAIELLGVGPSASPLTASPTPTASPAPLVEEEAQAAILQRPVPVSGALARAVGTQTPSAGRLLHAALGEERVTVRADAREALLAAFTADPEIEAAYLSTLRPVDDRALATIMRGSARGKGAEDLMATFAARAPSPELRAKAAAVLEELRRTQPDARRGSP
jgi:hypothetical protein